MKKILWLVLLLSVFIIPRCASTQSTRGGTLGDWTQNLMQNFNMEMGGIDSACVRMIQDMVRAGQLTPEQARYKIYRECKRPEQPQQQPSHICPMCGYMGTQKLGIGGAGWYWTCPNGHSWR